MTILNKLQVKAALTRFVAHTGNLQQAANKLDNIGALALQHILCGNWQHLNDDEWYILAKQIGYYLPENGIAHTGAFLMANLLMSDARNNAGCYVLIMPKGMGKSFAAIEYLNRNEGVMYLACTGQQQFSDILSAILQATNLNSASKARDIEKELAKQLAEIDLPLVIIDDAHKLNDHVLSKLIGLINGLTGTVGVVLLGTHALKDCITRGIELQKQGYEQFYTTLQQQFVCFKSLMPDDVPLLCAAYGIDIDKIAHEMEPIDNLTELIPKLQQLAAYKIAA